MTGNELLRRLRRYARERDLTFEENRRRGKGDHLIVRLAGRRSVIPDGPREIKSGTFHAICKQLDVDPKML